MAEAVAEAVVSSRHLVVGRAQGRAKSSPCLVPAILSGQIRVATPRRRCRTSRPRTCRLAEQLDVEFAWAVLKRRSNICASSRCGSGTGSASWSWRTARRAGTRWSAWPPGRPRRPRAPTGWTGTQRPSVGAVSVSSEDPGAQRCRSASRASRETAAAGGGRRRGVVNTRFGIDVGSRRRHPPRAGVVVTTRPTSWRTSPRHAGLAIGAGRFANLARLARRILADGLHCRSRTPAPTSAELAPWSPAAVTLPGHGRSLNCGRLATTGSPPPAIHLDGRGRADQRRRRKAAATLAEDVDAALVTPRSGVAWSVAGGTSPGWSAADVAPVLGEGVWSKPHCIHDATVPISLPDRGPAIRDRPARRRRPFIRGARAPHCTRPPARPAPARPSGRRHEPGLITAAGGRTLALFTSRRAMQRRRPLSPLPTPC
jgi:hypothetical protein